MKKKDLVTIVVVVIVSGGLSLVLSSVFFSPKKHITKVEVVQKITSDFPEPDKKYFNDQSINPTQLITIGNNANTKPFNGPKQ